MKLFNLLMICLLANTLAAQVQLTFRVDMSEQQVAASGVHVAGTFQATAGFPQDWDPSSVELFDDDGDGIYERTVSVAPNTYFYKFVNADNWGGAELPTADCAVNDGNGNFNRVITLGNEDTMLDVVCFGECAACGEGGGNTYNPVTEYDTRWWNDEVFYEIFVRSFYDSDGDGIGDFNGMTEKLDYLNDGDPNTDTDLGITGIWLMPMMPSPSYHGYDVTDYRDVEPDYGTMEDFQNFLYEAHARGIKVIIDFVMNHSSSQHPWFVESRNNPNSPFRDWYRWEDNNPNQTGPWGQNVWHNYGGDYYFGIFWGGMPDFNFENPDMKAEMFDIANYWIQDVGVDGFRIDAIRYLVEEGSNMSSTQGTFDVLEEFRPVYKGANPDALTVGEVWTSTPEVVQYVEDEDKLDLCFEFDLAYGILDAVNNNWPGNLDGQLRYINSAYPPLQMATFLTNHDIDRVYGTLGTSASKMKLAASLYLTLPGVPFLYYGEEIGMLGSGIDENKRKPMQWDESANGGFTSGSPWYPLNSNYTSFNVEEFQADENSLWHHYRQLIQWRHQYAPLRRGYFMPMESSNNEVLAFARIWQDEAILSLSNFAVSGQNNISFGMGATDLTPGQYYAYDLTNGQDLGTLSVNDEGGIDEWSPALSFGTRENLVVRLAQSPTSTSAPTVLEDVRIFPNPTKGNIELMLNTSETLQVRIFNAMGQLVHDQVIRSQKAMVDLSAFANGIYFVHLSDGNGEHRIQKVIKQ